MSEFIISKKTFKVSEFLKKNLSLSSQQYKDICLDEEYSIKISDLLVSKPQSGKEVGSDSYAKDSNYIFVRTKGFGKELFNLDLSINESYSFIKPNSYKDNCGKNKEKTCAKGDILFATGGDVGNVCFVSNDIPQNIISSHILKLNFGELQYYCLAFLKTDLIKDQVNLAPSGGIKGLDSFSIGFLLNARIPFPKYNKDSAIEYVSNLSKWNVLIENALFEKIKVINKKIENEIMSNQTACDYCYSFPKISEMVSVGRLDTLRYSELHKKTKYCIEHYINGSTSLSSLGYTFERGQNLQISNIGLSIYSDTYKQNYYGLTFSKNFTKYCTYSIDTYLGNKLELNQLERGDIVFSSRGDYGRVVIILDELQKTITNIDNIILKNQNQNLARDITICLLLNYYREIGFIRTIGFVGSGADSLTQGQIDSIPLPSFNQNFMDDLAHDYNSGQSIDVLNENSILDAINNFGIKELENIRLAIRKKLHLAILEISRGLNVNIEYNLINL